MSKDLCFIVVILYIVASPSLSGEPARLINGSVVSGTDYTEVVMLSADADAGRLRCSATVVGPRVVATAAHCAPRGATLHFRRGDTVYSGTFRASPRYTKPFPPPNWEGGKEHDIAVVVTDEEIQGVDAYVAVAAPESIAPGTALTLMGFGCAQAGAVSDNQLRIGDSAIARFVYHALQTNGHAILCPGDSGGPAFADIDGRKRLAGINSQTNYSSSWHTRVDSMESQQFLRSIAEEYEIDICGINSDCL